MPASIYTVSIASRLPSLHRKYNTCIRTDTLNTHHVIPNGGPDMTDDRRHDAFFVITSNNNDLTKPSTISPLFVYINF